ncbi:hypothetical protein TNCV_4723381 [Trichonephila clavipes]|uniref:Uncharacterized protein n=1 Tax=Trichonephila clavipes TaxID=2585209 RepID=A0A8X6W6J3_TRICX|nr:hypothetical protein TNCV_4723381 [Trichonephila clavipes]
MKIVAPLLSNALLVLAVLLKRKSFCTICRFPFRKSQIEHDYSDSCSPFQGYTDRTDSYYLFPSGSNANDSEMANLPTDMEMKLALSQRNSNRTPSPQSQFTPCEQLKYNKAQLSKMETFRRCKQACVDALVMMPDHYPEEPFYVRALTELQDVEETMALAVSDIDSFEPCNIPGCPHHEKTHQNSPLKMTQSTPKINPHDNNSGKRKDNSNFEYPQLRKTARKIILDIPDIEEINLSPNKFALPQGAQINNLENTGPVASGSNLASPREVTTNNGSNNSANQNAPQNQLPPPIMLFIEENY